MTSDTAAPSWFHRALETPSTRGAVTTAGGRIAYRAWGSAGAPGVLLIHGAGGHSHWWDHIAGLLAPDLHVVAMDLSGHGDSDWRGNYDFPSWAGEVAAVIADAFPAPPVLVGHSMGGFVALDAARRDDVELRAVVTVDSAVRDVTREAEVALRAFARTPPASYPTAEVAIQRFRLIPSQPAPGYLLDHIARTSIRDTGDGWTWKFDRKIFARPAQSLSLVDGLRCPLTFVTADDGVVSAPELAAVRARLNGDGRFVEIPDSRHHCMLDQPIALTTLLRAIAEYA